MSNPKAYLFLLGFVLSLTTLIFLGNDLASAIDSPTPPAQEYIRPTNFFVAKVYFTEKSELDWLASWLDIWEVNPSQSYLVTTLDQEAYQVLMSKGYKIWKDQQTTNSLNRPRTSFPAQQQGIPGFPCYRTVEETYSDLITWANERPDLVTLHDIGDSWQKTNPDIQPGYDLLAIVIHAKDKPYDENKPKLFVLAAIHAREYATAEMAMRFADHLIANYPFDPEVTWLLDHFEIHILPIANPDGRKLAEIGYYQRKNMNNSNGGQCAQPPMPSNQYGTDLNRNHTYQWGGASNDPCSTVYQGPSPASEPETQAVESYLRSLFPSQGEVKEGQPALSSTSGLFISLHSYGQLVLWPWGYTAQPPPNAAALEQLGKRLAALNHYYPTQSYNLYQTTGDSDDFTYGELGIPSFTFEMGTAFFQDCQTFENTIFPNNLQALLYAGKVTYRPYLLPFGPETNQVRAEPNTVSTGDAFTLTATTFTTTNDSQVITAARASLDLPSWLSESIFPLQAVDGSLDEPQEDLYLSMDTTNWTPGRHILFVEGQDNHGNWGPPATTFIWVASDSPHPLMYYFPLVQRP